MSSIGNDSSFTKIVVDFIDVEFYRKLQKIVVNIAVGYFKSCDFNFFY